MSEQSKPAATTDKPAEVPNQPAASVDATKVAADARSAERARMSAILGCEEAKGRAKLAQHLASSTDMTLEDAKKTLAASALEVGGKGGFAAAMRTVGEPEGRRRRGDDPEAGVRTSTRRHLRVAPPGVDRAA
jgi:hypothetical protein